MTIKMLELVNTLQSSFTDRFKLIMNLADEKSVEEKFKCGNDDDEKDSSVCTKEFLRINDGIHLTSKGVSTLVSRYQSLRELSLSYGLLSDELLTTLCSNQFPCLETLRVEIHEETKPLPRISKDVWHDFSEKLPTVNFALLSYITKEDVCRSIFSSFMPTTHLYFGETPAELILSQIGYCCPRLVELVISTYGPDRIDRPILSIARSCSQLSAIGLGDCEITCSALVKLVMKFTKRLRILYVWEMSLVEDAEYDVAKTISKVSSMLGRPWLPECIPMW